MTLKSVLLAGAAAVSLSLLSPAVATSALADDQTDETRELNLEQLDNPGYGDDDDDGADEGDDADDDAGGDEADDDGADDADD
jgi:hypothetical protein